MVGACANTFAVARKHIQAQQSLAKMAKQIPPVFWTYETGEIEKKRGKAVDKTMIISATIELKCFLSENTENCYTV